jgi:hypothetical protein
MIECTCINAKNRPKEIPPNKWIQKGDKYTVMYTVIVLPQRQLAFHLQEIELDETTAPYEYFLANRFAFAAEDLDALMELIKACSDTDFSMEELMKQTELETA